MSDIRDAARRHLIPHFTKAEAWQSPQLPVYVRGDGAYLWDDTGPAGARRPERPLLRADRPRPVRPRRSRGQADGDAGVHDQLGRGEPTVDRGGRADRRARTRRPRACLLRELGQRGRRVRGEARPQLPRRPRRRRPLQGHLPRLGVSRHDPRRALDHRGAPPAGPVPADAVGGRAQRAEHPPRRAWSGFERSRRRSSKKAPTRSRW